MHLFYSVSNLLSWNNFLKHSFFAFLVRFNRKSNLCKVKGRMEAVAISVYCQGLCSSFSASAFWNSRPGTCALCSDGHQLILHVTLITELALVRGRIGFQSFILCLFVLWVYFVLIVASFLWSSISHCQPFILIHLSSCQHFDLRLNSRCRNKCLTWIAYSAPTGGKATSNTYSKLFLWVYFFHECRMICYIS